MTTYPMPPAAVGSDLTSIEVHHLMKTPAALRKRLQTILAQRFIADFLLAGRFTAVGGAILYETGEEIFPADSAEAIQPGGGYPRTPLTSGELAAAKTVKWGQDVPVTDEAIARLLVNPLDKALLKVANGIVRDVDSAALGVIGSAVTQTVSVTTGTNGVNTGAWSTDDAIVQGIIAVHAKAEELNVGGAYNYDTVVLKPTQFAKVRGLLETGGLLPREGGNGILSGVVRDYMGITWARSTHVPFTDPLLVDREQLGGMADENIGGPGYSGGPNGIDVKTIREDATDSYLVRGRRVTVPVVTEPLAAVIIDDTGL